MLTSLELSDSQRSLLETATAAYVSQLDSPAVSYLAGRGLDQAGATGARLGVCREPVPGHERFKGMVSIPYLTPAGVVAIKFRCPEAHDCKTEGHSKYDQPSQHARLYNVKSLHEPGDVIAVCEGEFDTRIMSDRIGVPAVGRPGTTWLDYWPRVFADYERVLVVADNDVKEDGSNPGLTAAKKVVNTMSNAELVVPPPGLDITDWFLASGADEIRERMGV